MDAVGCVDAVLGHYTQCSGVRRILHSAVAIHVLTTDIHTLSEKVLN